MIEMDPSERRAAAEAHFRNGCNCSQAVVLAFSDLLPVDRELLARLSSSFGGGMGRMREVCGAVSGMLLVAGALYGFDANETGPAKNEHYARIQALAGEFKAAFGSIVCRDLLGKPAGPDAPEAAPRTTEYYQKRPCGEMVGAAAALLARYIAENGSDAGSAALT